jgi:hypothetical protein
LQALVKKMVIKKSFDEFFGKRVKSRIKRRVSDGLSYER